MDEPTLCPVCRDNRTNFMLIVKLGQEIIKDGDTGTITYASDEWETVTYRNKPAIELRCELCDHTAAADDFVRAARRDDRRLPRIGGRHR